MGFRQFYIIPIIVSLWLNVPTWAAADRIILKDGTVEESEKIWESKAYIHFILKGTDSIEIRYAKNIVDRIERSNSIKIITTPRTEVNQNKVHPNDASANKKENTSIEDHRKDLAVDTRKYPQKYLKIIKNCKGVSFYNPRRTNRYWASPDSRHDNLQNALYALAKLYSRQPEWVEKHMGEENDLGGIHRNLMKQLQFENNSPGNRVQQNVPVTNQFFTAGSRQPYQVRIGQRYTTRDEAVSALSAMYDKPNNWIEKHMGNSNELNQIHGNLLRAKSLPEKVNSGPSLKKHDGFPKLDISKDMLFYDPRRTEKYWTDKMVRHHTLRDAVEALARLYEVSPEWVENHMGNTNNLVEIHQNIQNSLSIK